MTGLDRAQEIVNELKTLHDRMTELEAELVSIISDTVRSADAQTKTELSEALFTLSTYWCLRKTLLYVEELTEISEDELMQIRNFGITGLLEVRYRLAELGLKPRFGYTECLPSTESLSRRYQWLAARPMSTVQILAESIGLILSALPVDPAQDVPAVELDEDDAETRMSDIHIGPHFVACLKRGGIETMGDLVSKSEYELLQIPQFGPWRLLEIRFLLRRIQEKPRGGYMANIRWASLPNTDNKYSDLVRKYDTEVPPRDVGLPDSVEYRR